MRGPLYLYLELLKQNKTWYDLDSIEKVQIRTIANSNSKAASNAKAVLHLINDEWFEREIDTSYSSSSMVYGAGTIFNSEENNDELFRVYPIPTINILNIDYSYTDQHTLKIENILGKIVAEYKLNNGYNTKTIDLSNFESGVYFISVYNSNNHKVTTKKFIKRNE